MAKPTTFERVIADLFRGDSARAEDLAELERRAAGLHNDYPRRIDALNAELKSVKTVLDALRVELEVRSEAIIQAVVMAETPEGRKLYSNEMLRAIEVKKRIAADAACAQVAVQIAGLEERHNMNVVLLQRAKNDYAAWKDMLRFEVAALK